MWEFVKAALGNALQKGLGNRVWMFLFALAGGVCLWFGGKAAGELWRYHRVGPSTTAEVNQWSVRELSPSQFVIEAVYSYTVGEIPFQGTTLFRQPIFLNPFSAEKDIQKWEGQSWRVWYDAKHPSFSTLQKLFPFKACVQALIACAILLYFFFMRMFFLKAR